jgi:hypothetical protein
MSGSSCSADAEESEMVKTIKSQNEQMLSVLLESRPSDALFYGLPDLRAFDTDLG